MEARSTRRTLTLVLGVAVSLVFGALAVRNVDFRVFWDGLTTMEYVWLVPALVALVATFYLRAVRWRLLFAQQTRPPFRAALRALLIGLFFNQILPLRAGEAARVVALNQESGTSRAEALGTAVVERIYDVLALLVILFIAWPFLPTLGWISGAATFALVFVALVAVAAVCLFVFGASLLRLALAPFALLPRISRGRTDAAASNLAGGLGILHRPRFALAAFAVTMLSWLVAGISYWCVLQGFDFGPGLAGALLLLVTTNLALVIPSLPAGVGVFEAATILTLASFDVGDSEALACAVVLHSVNFFPYIAAGLVALHGHATIQRRRARTQSVAT